MRKPLSDGASMGFAKSIARPSLLALWTVMTTGICLWNEPLAAAVCSVPGNRATIQNAVDDPSCTRINLGNRVYVESVLVHRSVSIVGPAEIADIAGLVEVRGSGTVADFTNIKVENGCTPGAFVTSDGGQAEASSLEVVTTPGGPCPPSSSGSTFRDGFESGDTSAWSARVP